MACESCGDKPKKCNKDFTKAVIEIDNPGCVTLMRKVSIPASMGDDQTVPPSIGKYRNVLLNYEANNKTYLYSSDGIPVQLNNGFTDYEAAINLPQINGNTVIGDKTGDQLGLQNKLTAGDGIEINSNNVISIANIEQYAHFFDTIAAMSASTNLKNGDFAKTCGYLRRGDGVYNIYKVRQKTGADTIDGYELVDVSNGGSLIAERIQYGNKLVIELLPSDNIQDYLDLVAEKIIILPKSASITTSDSLYINSDTTIDLNQSTLNARRINLYRLDDTFTGYSGNKNIVIKNGTIDDSEIICMHNKSVLIENVTFTSVASGSHVFQIAACYDFIIRNCEFNGTYPSTDYGSECINIDPCNYGGQPWMPEDSPMYDHTKNRNILIESNVFNNPSNGDLRYTAAIGSHGRDDDGQTICEGLIIRNNDFGSPFHSAINMCDYIDVMVENNIATFDSDNMDEDSSFIIARHNQQKIVVDNNNTTGSVQFVAFLENSTAINRSNIYISNNTFSTNDDQTNSSLLLYRVNNCHVSQNNATVSRCFARVPGDASSVEGGQRASNVWIEQNTIYHPGGGGSNIVRLRYVSNATVNANIFKITNSSLGQSGCVGIIDDITPSIAVTNNLANAEIGHFTGQIEMGGFRNNEALYRLASGFDQDSLSESGDLSYPITLFRTIVLMMGTASNMRLVELKPWVIDQENFDTDARTWRIPVLNNDNTTGYATLSITDSGTKYSYSGSIPIRALLGKD